MTQAERDRLTVILLGVVRVYPTPSMRASATFIRELIERQERALEDATRKIQDYESRLGLSNPPKEQP